MASIIYNRFLADMAQGDVDIDTGGDTIKVQLHTSSYTPNKDHNTTADLTNEVTGTGYTAGGETLAGQSVTQDDSNDLMKFDATDVTWSGASITARYAVLVDTTNTNSLIACIDFGEDKTADGGDFVIEWNASGILTIAQS